VCSSTTDIVCNDEGGTGITPGSRVTRALSPGSYYALVQEYNSTSFPAVGGTYNLSATVTAQAANAVCTAPIALVSGTPRTGQDSAASGAQSTACFTTAGGQLFYSVDVPANNRAAITVTPTGMTPVSMATRILTGCAATTCAGSASGTTPQTLNYDNRTMATQTIIVSVSATTAGANGTFDVVANIAPIPFAPNASCATPTVLTVGAAAITGETIDNGGNPITTCLPGQAGLVRYYSVDVPARGSVSVTATPTNFNVGLRVLSSCAATTCAEFADNSTSTTTAENVRITNPSMSTQTYIVAISSTTTSTTGTYSIVAATAAPAPATNAFCDSPTALTSGTAVSGELAQPGGMPLDTVCLPTQTGYVRYYSISVPSGSTMQALVTPGATNGVNVGIRLLSSCAATTCAAGNDASTGTTATGLEGVVVSNTSGSAQNYIVAASALNTATTATNNYSVVANVAATGANGLCSGATPLTLGTALNGESIVGGGAAPTGCSPSAIANGLTKFYRVTLAAGERVSVTATPTNFNVNLRALDSCGATACVDSVDSSTSATTAERVEMQNNTGMSKDFFVAVGAPANVTTGTFNIVAARTPYTETAITAACTDLSAAPDLLGPATTTILGDDTVSANTALPMGFAFSYFGTAVTNFTAGANGFAQLWPNATSTGNTTFTNAAIPTTGTPNSTVAALWDDLYPVTGVSRIRTAESGTAPNRVFTIEWFDMGFRYTVPTTGPGPERLRFQVKLYETTNVIEYHYCSLVLNGGSPDLLSGSSSTIGIENAAGTDAARHSFNIAGSITSGSGLRYTAQP
jgi:hypothetical protein